MNTETISPLPAPRPLGVTFFAVLLIISSLLHMRYLLSEHDTYMYIYGYLPHWLAVVRYFFSWFQRILGLTAAVGLLRRNELGRKLAIFIAIFSILTIYWKHPYAGFKNHTAYLDEHLGFLLQGWGYPELSFSQFTLAAVIVAWVWDILFFGSMIYYLTRPSVKGHFV